MRYSIKVFRNRVQIFTIISKSKWRVYISILGLIRSSTVTSFEVIKEA